MNLAGSICFWKGWTYHVLVAEEEHECHWIVQLVHLLEVWNLV